MSTFQTGFLSGYSTATIVLHSTLLYQRRVNVRYMFPLVSFRNKKNYFFSLVAIAGAKANVDTLSPKNFAFRSVHIRWVWADI